MQSSYDFIIRHIKVFIFLLFLTSVLKAECQEGILDSAFTFREGMIKTGNALNAITKKTGYYFTYDSKLVDTEKKTEMNFREVTLRKILNGILKNDSLDYSVINKYIIIYKVIRPLDSVISSRPENFPGYITGVVTDGENGDPLPYATIVLKNTGKGTVSNNNGEFGLNIPNDSYNDSIIVSYLGYLNRRIPVRQIMGNNLTITMTREFISIPEIIIRNHVPQELLRKAFAAIQSNYGNSPAYLTGFYREGVMKKNDLHTYSEAIINIYKSPYSGSLQHDQMKIFKSRKIENTDVSDTLTVRLKAGLSTCLDLDIVRSGFEFLMPDNFTEYNYKMTDIVSIDEETAYQIDFVQKEDIDLPLFQGSVYINASDFGIMLAVFEINPGYIHKSRDSFITSSSRGYITWPSSVKYSVSYRKMNGRYFLHHVRGDLTLVSRKKKALFKTQFNVFFELAITGIELKNVVRFERDELAPIHSIFSRTIVNYDREFWGDQDFLKPEDNLLNALKDMKVKLSEFSK
jgi:hypothetical protein